MNTDWITRHASERMQQRAIPPFVLTFLEEFGSAHHCSGAERLIFDKAAQRRLKRHLGGERGMKVIEPWLEVYAVIGQDGRLVTACHSHRRMWRD